MKIKVSNYIADFLVENGIEDVFTSTVITGQSWVTTNSKIVATLFGEDVGNRSAEDGILEEIKLSITNLVPGVGFTVMAYAPNNTSGNYKINCIGS